MNHMNGGGRAELELKGNWAFYTDILSGKRNTNDLNLLCANCNIIYEYERGKRKP